MHVIVGNKNTGRSTDKLSVLPFLDASVGEVDDKVEHFLKISSQRQHIQRHCHSKHHSQSHDNEHSSPMVDDRLPDQTIHLRTKIM